MMRWIVRLAVCLVVLAVLVAVAARGGLPIVANELLKQRETGQLAFTYDRMESESDALRVRRRLSNVRMETPSGLQVGIETLTVAAPAWDWRRLDWQAEGMIRVERPGAWVLTATDADGRAVLSLPGLLRGDSSLPSRLSGLTVRAPAVRLDSPLHGAGIAAQTFTLDYDHGAETVLAIAGTEVRPAGLGLFGEEFPPAERAALQLQAVPGVPSDAGLDALQSWSAEGGALRIDHAWITMGPSTVDVQGVLELDEGLQPTGQGTVRLSGFDDFIGLLIDMGIIARDAASVARVATGVMAAADNDGDPDVLSMPLRIEDGEVFAGEFLLMRLPVIIWPY